jgi:ADP-ribose pyrophosphatase YjhB (NUDIX family)
MSSSGSKQDGRLRFHFVVVVMRMAWETGEPVAGDDASEARWMELEALAAAGDGGYATAARLPGAGKQR